MTIPISDAQRDALAQISDRPLVLVDPQSQQSYVLVEREPMPEISDEHLAYMKQGVEIALQQVAEGKTAPWDIEEVIRRGQERLANKPNGQNGKS